MGPAAPVVAIAWLRWPAPPQALQLMAELKREWPPPCSCPPHAGAVGDLLRQSASRLSAIGCWSVGSDLGTGSQWDLFRQAVAGPLKGESLAPVEGGVHFAFAWLANPVRQGGGSVPTRICLSGQKIAARDLDSIDGLGT
jgi:hypothetical protein